MNSTPIVLFAFNRPEHLQRTLESLERNNGADRSRLIIFLDGPRSEKDKPRLKAVREIAEGRRWCGSREIIARDRNLGCARSIIDGVTTVCREAGSVIVLEDDLVLSPWFLDFMHAALGAYAETENIMHVSGYMYPVDSPAPHEALFLPLMSPWGWATWWRAWEHFDPDAAGYDELLADRDLRRKFDLDGCARHFHFLESQLQGRIDSWAIRWYLTVFMRGALSLYPGRSLVQNIGFDGSGLHCRAESGRAQDQLTEFPTQRLPDNVAVNEAVFRLVRDYYARR